MRKKLLIERFIKQIWPSAKQTRTEGFVIVRNYLCLRIKLEKTRFPDIKPSSIDFLPPKTFILIVNLIEIVSAVFSKHVIIYYTYMV